VDSSRPSTSHSHAIPDDVGVSKVSDDPDTTGVVCDSEAATASATLQAQMENIIKQSMAVQPTLSGSAGVNMEKTLAAAVRTEMVVFQSSGVRGRSLQQVYEYLLSIPPASVEAERSFSAAGQLSTKIRSRLSDATLDKLCFLRSFFRSNSKKQSSN